ncbi:unnamed protein product [Mucor hiemalis]
MSHIRLSLPKGISTSTVENDTFSRDLLRQFDKKRSRLHYELGFASQEPSPESSIIMTPAISEYYNEEPVQLDDIEPIIESQQHNNKRYIPSQNSNATSSKRSSSASELFRRSSAFLRSKFDIFRAGKPEEEQEQESTDHSRQPKKLMMKTTISIPSTNTITARSSFSPLLSTPTITQYPPKPLVYSPIEPIPNTSDKQNAKPLLHRISMPLLRVYNDTTTNLTRNKSITSFGRRRKSEPDNNTKKKLKRAKQQQQQQQQ